jgi:hypothetical protein
MNRRRLSYLAALIWFCGTAAVAADKPPSEEEIKTLVQQLVSPNQAPVTKSPYAKYPAGYDERAQERVLDAWLQLRRLGPRAFPYLFDFVDDKRYSFTADGGAADVNWSVGQACLDRIRCSLQPYGPHYLAGEDDPRGFPRRPNYVRHHNIHEPAGAKTWWETRKDKSLRELQIETLEWVIAEEAKTPEKYSNRERAFLKKVLTKLRTAKEPLKPSVPWLK